MKRFKSSLAVSAITAMSAIGFVFWGCTKEEEKVTEKTINGIECVLVEAGTFWMGSPASERVKPNDEIHHQVTISRDFWISKYPITNKQYGKTVGTGMEDNPVMEIYWEDAYAFARKIGGRLPTEAQWEYAARGGNKSKGYIYSGSNNLDEVAWHKGNSGGVAHKVGTKAPNELGIYDMTGNVYEWCADWYGGYGVAEETGKRTDPFNNTITPGYEVRILRGGDYTTDNNTSNDAGNQKRELRIAYREGSYDIKVPKQRHSAATSGIRVIFYEGTPPPDPTAKAPDTADVTVTANIARVTFYGGEEREGSDLQNRNQLFNEDGTPRWYENNNHKIFGYGGVTVEEAYMVLKYPTITATHEGSTRGVRHAGGMFTLGDNGDHAVGPTYAIKLTNLYPSRLGTIEVEPGEYGDPWVRVFWPGADAQNADAWWNAMIDVDAGAKAALKAANAGYIYKGKMRYFKYDTTTVEGEQVIRTDTIVYTYEVRGKKEIGPIPLPTRQQTQPSGQFMQWDLAAGNELELKINTHSNHWMGRYRDLQVYKDLPRLAEITKADDPSVPDRHIIITPGTMANYTLRAYADVDVLPGGTPLVSDANKANFPTAGKTFADLIDDELFRAADASKGLGQRLGFDIYYSKQYKW